HTGRSSLLAPRSSLLALRPSPSVARLLDQDEAVAVLVLEERLHHAPRLPGGLLGEVHAPAAQFLVGGLDVVGGEDDADERADPALVVAAVALRQDDPRLRARRRDDEPAQPLAHRLIVADLEAELGGVEVERLVLVADRDAGGGDVLNHGSSSLMDPADCLGWSANS